MIYQLAPTIHHNNSPFSEYYLPLCLDCLEPQYFPQLMMEYSGMIYAWKNDNNHEWIGFTSYRQLSKSSFILTKSNLQQAIDNLINYDILCFYFLNFAISISDQAEKYQKDINCNIKMLFDNIFKESIPPTYYSEKCGCFGNYWIMSKNNFNSFMEWSYPKVSKILELSKDIPYLSINKHHSNTGFIIERLFLIWYLKENKSLLPLFTKNL